MLKKWCTRLPDETYHRMRQHCAITCCDIELFAYTAIETYIDDYENEKKIKDINRSGATITFR